MGKILVSSLFAGAASELAVLPICTVQTIYQTQKDLNGNRVSIPNITKQLYKRGGIKSFYNASLSGVLSQVVSTGSKYTLYKIIQDYRGTEPKNVSGNMINGISSGILAILFTQPFDVAKNFNQRQKYFLPQIKSDPFILYRGSLQSVYKSVALMSILYPINDFCKQYISNTFFAAISTTLITVPIIHPLDLLKRRALAGKCLWLGYNPLNYYRGLLINWCRATPHFAVTMCTIDFIGHLYDFF